MNGKANPELSDNHHLSRRLRLRDLRGPVNDDTVGAFTH
jgi:hypothetical protein